MWRTIGTLLTRAGEALGIELPEPPDVTALSDAVTGAAEVVADQAGEAIAPLADLSPDIGPDLAAAGETVTGALDSAVSDTTAPLTDLVPHPPAK